MRLRYIPEAEQTLKLDKEYMINDLPNLRHNWQKVFTNGKLPVCLEIGTGKGRFIMTHAQNNPLANFLGVEKFASPLFLAWKKIRRNNPDTLTNLKLICVDVTTLFDSIPNHSIQTIYLNFSDPWPKKRHAKRRLTADTFLKAYQLWLVPQGTIVLKTDNQNFFHFSLDSFKNNNWKIIEQSTDLYASPFITNNIATEYEQKFHKLGQPIYYVKVTYNH